MNRYETALDQHPRHRAGLPLEQLAAGLVGYVVVAIEGRRVPSAPPAPARSIAPRVTRTYPGAAQDRDDTQPSMIY